MALRHTISPQLSNRHSPPVTRSVSRNGRPHLFEATSTPITRKSLQPGQIHISQDIERVFESADDTENELNTSKFIYREHFTAKEMTSMKKEMWYDWVEYQVRMIRRHFVPSADNILKILFALAFISMIIRYSYDCLYPYQPQIIHGATLDDQWKTEIKRTDEAISHLQTHFENMVDTHQNLAHRFASLEEKLRNNEGFKESMIDELKEIKAWNTYISDSINSLKTELEERKSAKIIPTEEEKPIFESIPSATSSLQILPHDIHANRFPSGVNVANSLIGASIDNSCSSRSVSAKDGIFYDLLSYFGSFQEGYVLLDRELLSPGEAWCTYDKRATLTVKLARFIKPTAVSYQHVRWNRIVPNHAPKLYDLVACLDPCCTKSEPIVSDCEYRASEDGHDEQEQFCIVPVNPDATPIDRVQFRFRENHGNMEKTCAYLVRVYGEPTTPPKEKVPENGTSSHFESTVIDSMSDTV
ncbi:unnamed protein product [Caenorhabditis brenneri]